MEMGPQLKVSSDRLVIETGIEPATLGLQGKWFIHYTTAAPTKKEESDHRNSFMINFHKSMETGWDLTDNPGSATRLVKPFALWNLMGRGTLTLISMNDGEFSIFLLSAYRTVSKLTLAENSKTWP